MRTFVVFLAFALTTMVSADAGKALRGVFALQDGVGKTDGYLNASPLAARPGSWSLDFWMTHKNGDSPIRAYDLDMTKLMHVIIVSDDFRTFIHSHPRLLPSGDFALNQSLPKRGLYHIYSDGRPSGIGQQVFRFDLLAGSVRTPATEDLSERNAVAGVDGYAVSLSRLSLKPNDLAPIAVTISKNGKPARDIHPYLGALAHAVFLDADDLTYVHVHPVSVGSMPMQPASAMVYSNDNAIVSPNMLLHVMVNRPGTYKLWLQFRGGPSLHVASFVLTAQ